MPHLLHNTSTKESKLAKQVTVDGIQKLHSNVIEKNENQLQKVFTTAKYTHTRAFKGKKMKLNYGLSSVYLI